MNEGSLVGREGTSNIWRGWLGTQEGMEMSLMGELMIDVEQVRKRERDRHNGCEIHVYLYMPAMVEHAVSQGLQETATPPLK